MDILYDSAQIVFGKYHINKIINIIKNILMLGIKNTNIIININTIIICKYIFIKTDVNRKQSLIVCIDQNMLTLVESKLN